MIKAVIATESTSTGKYYFVSWSTLQMLPCWIDDKIYQEAITTPIDNYSNLLSNDRKEKKGKKEQAKTHQDIVIPLLDKEKASSRSAIVEFFAWRKQKCSKELTQAEKKQKEGVKRYDSPLILSLQRICRELQAVLQKPNQETYDDLIDYIQGYAFSKSHRMFLVANLLGKKKKVCIPLKNMKKYFPQTLKDYLKEIIELQQDNYRKQQQGGHQFFQGNESSIEERRYEGNSYYFEDSSPNPSHKQKKSRKASEGIQQDSPPSQDIESSAKKFPSMSIEQPRHNHTHFLASFFSNPTLQLGNKLKPNGAKRSQLLYRNDSEDSSDEDQSHQ